MHEHGLLDLPHNGAGFLTLGRKALQGLAKQHGIKANLSSDAIVDQLLGLRAKMLHEQPPRAQPNAVSSPERPRAGDASPTAQTTLALPADAGPIADALPAVPPETIVDAGHRGASQPAAPPSYKPLLMRSTTVPHLPEKVPMVEPPTRVQPGADSPAYGASPAPRAVTPARNLAPSGSLPRSPAASRQGGAPSDAPDSVAKRKSPGFMAPLRRHSSVMETSTHKRQSTGAPRTPGRVLAEKEDGGRGKENDHVPGVDSAMVKHILGEVVLSGNGVSWDDIGARAAYPAYRTHVPATASPSLRA